MRSFNPAFSHFHIGFLIKLISKFSNLFASGHNRVTIFRIQVLLRQLHQFC